LTPYAGSAVTAFTPPLSGTSFAGGLSPFLLFILKSDE